MCDEGSESDEGVRELVHPDLALLPRAGEAVPVHLVVPVYRL